MNPLYLVFGPIILAPLAYFLPRGWTKYAALLLFGWMMQESIALFRMLPDHGYLLLGRYLNVDAIGFALTLQVDRLSVVMLLLTALLLILVAVSSWRVCKNANAYFALLILFAGPIFGVFMSTNLLWFFIFWELTLVPMFFLIGFWGAERRIYAAVKFFLYTHVASMLILLAFFLIRQQTGVFDMTLVRESMLATPALVWWLLFLGFAVKMPLFPFHTWLPDAHVQAPAPVSVLLAGVLLKMGAYAMIRMGVLMLPESAHRFALVLLAAGVVTLFYAGFMALYETHLKKMVAYSSISHMGLVAVGIATLSAPGLSAALFEMIGHALIISPLFLIAGFLHHRTGSWQMEDMGGLMQRAPYLSALFVFAGLAALGLPGTMGFVGELTILLGAVDAYGVVLALIAVGSIFSAGYLIRAFRRVIYGECSPLLLRSDLRPDAPLFAVLVAFAALILFFGLWPQPLFDLINPIFEEGLL